MVHHHRKKGYIILIAACIIFFAILPFFFEDLKQYASPQYAREQLLEAGSWGYLLFIGLLILSIPLPIPSMPVILAGGYVYGTLFGSIITYVGIVLGASISFFLVRKLGRPLLERMVEKHHIVHFNHILKKRGLPAIFLAFMIPIFPSDTLYLLLGLTRISYLVFLFMIVIGSIPRIFLINSLGSDLYTGISVSSIWIIVGSAILMLVAIFRERIKRLLFKELREVEHDVEHEVDILERLMGLKRHFAPNRLRGLKRHLSVRKLKGLKRHLAASKKLCEKVMAGK